MLSHGPVAVLSNRLSGARVREALLEDELAGTGQLSIDTLHEIDHFLLYSKAERSPKVMIMYFTVCSCRCPFVSEYV